MEKHLKTGGQDVENQGSCQEETDRYGLYGARLPPGGRSPAPYAACAVSSRGRFHLEPGCPVRSPFQRDRDRILHSTAFRRLMYKTQVFVFHERDHYRTRLTHSLEVAQIGRAIARQLRLDEDLTEALALAHDLGHPPFGHAGERALDAALRQAGDAASGFDHNAQSLRIVTCLERKYLGFDGLNLTWETLEGLAKHNGPVLDPAHPVRKALSALDAWQSFAFERQAPAEAQVAALADDIAYLAHDVDDGLRSGLITFSALAAAPLAGPLTVGLDRADGSRRAYELSRRLITLMISSVVTESRVRLAALAPSGPDAIRAAPQPVAAFPGNIAKEAAGLKAFLYERLYRHPEVMAKVTEAGTIVQTLFGKYMSDISALPHSWREGLENADRKKRARRTADFIAGMTDRFAVAEYRRLS